MLIYLLSYFKKIEAVVYAQWKSFSYLITIGWDSWF